MLDQDAIPPMDLAPAPLTLENALALANAHNEQLGLRGEDYLQALINKNRAVANFLPTVSFQPTFTIEQKPHTSNASTTTAGGGTTTAGGGTFSSSGSAGGFRTTGDTLTRFEAPVVGAMNLFRGGGDIANLYSAEQQIIQRRDLLLDAQATVLLNVAQDYYQVLRSERQTAVLRDSLNLQEARLADITDKFNNGLAVKLDVAQSRAQAEATRVQLEQSMSDVRNGRSTLAFVIGVDAVSGPLVDRYTVPREIPAEIAFEKSAIFNRRDLTAAAAAVAAARYNVENAIAEYYPSVSLNVAGFLYREFFSSASKWDAVLQANLPIFSAGLIEADVRAAWSRLRQAALQESYLRRNILQDVQISYENLVTATRKISELQAQVDASEEALRQAQQAYANGLQVNLDVLTAQTRCRTPSFNWPVKCSTAPSSTSTCSADRPTRPARRDVTADDGPRHAARRHRPGDPPRTRRPRRGNRDAHQRSWRPPKPSPAPPPETGRRPMGRRVARRRADRPGTRGFRRQTAEPLRRHLRVLPVLQRAAGHRHVHEDRALDLAEKNRPPRDVAHRHPDPHRPRLRHRRRGPHDRVLSPPPRADAVVACPIEGVALRPRHVGRWLWGGGNNDARHTSHSFTAARSEAIFSSSVFAGAADEFLADVARVPRLQDRPHDRRVVDLLLVVQFVAAGDAGGVVVGDVVLVLLDAGDHVPLHDLDVVDVEEQLHSRGTDLVAELRRPIRCVSAW